MKINNLKAFEKHVKDASPNHLSNVYLIIGKEAFNSKAAARYIIEALLPSHSSHDTALRWFDADKHSVQDLLVELNTLSFLSDRKVIGLHNTDKLSKDALKQLENEFERLPSSFFLLLLASSIASNTTFYKKAEKSGVILEISEMKPWEKERYLIDWVREEITKKGRGVSHQLCHAFVKRVGMDQSQLVQEIEKLLCYIGENKEITINDLHAIVSNSPEESIWELGEAIFSKESSSALRIARSLMSDEAQLFSLLRQIRYQFQTKYQVLGLYEQSGTAGVTQEFAYMKGQILDQHLRLAQQYGRERFHKGLLAIDRAEIDAKNSKGSPELILDMLIIKLTS